MNLNIGKYTQQAEKLQNQSMIVSEYDQVKNSFQIEGSSRNRLADNKSLDQVHFRDKSFKHNYERKPSIRNNNSILQPDRLVSHFEK